MSFSYHFGITDANGGYWTGYEPCFPPPQPVTYILNGRVHSGFIAYNPTILKAEKIFFRFCITCGHDRMLFPTKNDGRRSILMWPYNKNSLPHFRCFTCENIPLPEGFERTFASASAEMRFKAQSHPVISCYIPDTPVD